MIDGGATEVVEIVRQDLRREAHGDALGALGQHEREFRRQGHRLPGAAVVAELPDRGLGIEDDLARERREAGLDVARRRRAVAREHVAEVALRLDEQTSLGHADQRGLDRGVTVRMEAHAGADDVGHLVESAVIHFPQRVQDAALHRFQTIVEMGNGAIEDDVAGVVEKPVAIALRERGILGILDFRSPIFDFARPRRPGAAIAGGSLCRFRLPAVDLRLRSLLPLSHRGKPHQQDCGTNPPQARCRGRRLARFKGRPAANETGSRARAACRGEHNRRRDFTQLN